SGSHDCGAAWRCGRVVGGAVRVNPEGFVFFNDPAVVLNERQSADAGSVSLAVTIILGIDHIDREIARGWEGDGRGSGGGPSLRILHRVREGGRGTGCARGYRQAE